MPDPPRRRRTNALRIVLMLAALIAMAALYTKQPMCAPPPHPGADEVSSERLRSDVERLVALSPRDVGTPDGNRAAARFIEERFREAGLVPERSSFQVDGERDAATNIVAHVGPDDGPMVVVGAHYDACGPHPGADDNASGVAALLELARLLAKEAPKRRVELVAYANEEPPHFGKSTMGSVHHADALAERHADVIAMICLEMVGYFDRTPRTQAFPVPLIGAMYPSSGDFIAVVGDIGGASLVRDVKGSMLGASPLAVESINAPASLPGVDFSDHRSYWKHGYPAVMITDTAFFRNDRYHTERDTPDSLDYDKMADVVRGVHAAVMKLAN